MKVLPLALLALPVLVSARPHGHRRSRYANSTEPHHHARKRACTVTSSSSTPMPPTSTGSGSSTTPPPPIFTVAPTTDATSAPTSTAAPTTTSSAPGSGSTSKVPRGMPADGIRGVNLGSMMVIEPWMMEQAWRDMGGEICDSCMDCVSTEFDLVKKLGQDAADAAFKQHWDTFITKDDVDLIASYNLNSVRIPLGFWIIEEEVNRDNEYYPKGGLDALRQLCGWLADANITVLLDMHAAPGGSTGTNAFAGRCVDPPQFWGNSGNVARHVAAAKKLTQYIHSEPEHFRTVWGLEALNEPPQDGSQTPGYADFMSQFVQTVRGVEKDLNVTEADQLQTVFMDVSWQWKDNAGNPAYAANGGNAFDTHVYLNWGGAAGPDGNAGDDINSHIAFTCNGDGGKIKDDASKFNTPLFKGEFWLLGKTTDILPNDDMTNIQRWGDAQKMGYSKDRGGNGWYFWSWKLLNDDSGGWTHMRSYKDAVEQGYMHKDAAKYFNPDVCG